MAESRVPDGDAPELLTAEVVEAYLAFWSGVGDDPGLESEFYDALRAIAEGRAVVVPASSAEPVAEVRELDAVARNRLLMEGCSLNAPLYASPAGAANRGEGGGA